MLPYNIIDPDTGEPYDPGNAYPPGGGGAIDPGTGLPTDGPIQQFYSKFNRYPGNNKQWWVAKAAGDDPDATPPIVAGQFLPDALNKYWAGNNRAPQGHYILQAFYKDRTGVSGIPGLDVEVTPERPTTVAFFSGRAWFACNTTVYFSQILLDKKRAGMCYQEADPTAEDISDLVATDGGVIPVPDAGKIIKLLPNAGSILVFALNGVWSITGGQSGFSALDMSISKVSPIGCKSPESVVETDTSVYWWSDAGILGMTQSAGSYGPISGSFEKANISQGSIQTFYNNISEAAKRECKGIYDAQNNVVIWLYRDDDVGPTQYNRILNLDVNLKAFYPWKVATDTSAEGRVVKGLFSAQNKTVNDNDPNRDSYIRYLALGQNYLTFNQFSSTAFVDWGQEPYNSYVETGFELFDDAMRNKNITYIYSYFKRTESEYNAATNEVDRPSSCYLQVKFDWANGLSSNKWTTPVQVYRNSRLTLDPDTGFAMIISKDKIRGNGKAIQFRYGTDEPGKDFDLHGWSVAVSGNTNP